MIFDVDSVVEAGLNYSVKRLQELSLDYERLESSEDIVIKYNEFIIEYFHEGIIISGDNLELGYYTNEFEKESEYLFSFKKDFDLVVEGKYRPNLKGFFNKTFVPHYKPDPFSSDNTSLKFLIALVGIIVFLKILFK